MQLIDLLKDFFWICLCGQTNIEITGICEDSRLIQEGNIFVCIEGSREDGHIYIREAIEKGAAAIIVSCPSAFEDYMPEKNVLTWIQVRDTRNAIAHMAAAYYRYPAKKLKIVGITGTKGKTTTSYMLRNIFREAGYKTGLIGTVEIDDGCHHIDACRTTPSALQLHGYLNDMVNHGIQIVVMEVSSQGLKQHRVDGIIFDFGVLTNISKDHIGPYEHRNMDEYISCKSALFAQCKRAAANQDSPLNLEAVAKAECPVCMYSLKHLLGEHQGEYICRNGEHIKIDTNMPGYFNRENALAAIICADAMMISPNHITRGLKMVQVPGRMEIIPLFKNFTVMIDYAHNAASLEMLLTELRKVYTGRILCMFGCGGNRDKRRRREMGRISGMLADLTVITTDNPRYENPLEIIKDIENGIKETKGNYTIIPDRSKAIIYSIQWAQKNDLIILAGKGHEHYQEVDGKIIPFNEKNFIYEQFNSVIY